MDEDDSDMDEAFLDSLTGLVAALIVMHPMQLKNALEFVNTTIDEEVMPTKELKDAYHDVLKVAAGKNPGKEADAKIMWDALSRWRQARDKADAFMEAKFAAIGNETNH